MRIFSCGLAAGSEHPVRRAGGVYLKIIVRTLVVCRLPVITAVMSAPNSIISSSISFLFLKKMAWCMAVYHRVLAGRHPPIDKASGAVICLVLVQQRVQLVPASPLGQVAALLRKPVLLPKCHVFGIFDDSKRQGSLQSPGLWYQSRLGFRQISLERLHFGRESLDLFVVGGAGAAAGHDIVVGSFR